METSCLGCPNMKTPCFSENIVFFWKHRVFPIWLIWRVLWFFCSSQYDLISLHALCKVLARPIIQENLAPISILFLSEFYQNPHEISFAQVRAMDVHPAFCCTWDDGVATPGVPNGFCTRKSRTTTLTTWWRRTMDSLPVFFCLSYYHLVL